MRRVIPLLLVLGGCATQQPAPDYYGQCVVGFGYPAGSPAASRCAQSLAERDSANRAAMGSAWLQSGGMQPMRAYQQPYLPPPVQLTSPPPMNVRCVNVPNGRNCTAY